MKILSVLILSTIYLFRPGQAIPPHAVKLMQSYPDFIAGYINNRIVFKDHSAMVWDDNSGIKSTTELIAKPDIKDMFLQPYTKGLLTADPVKNSDPGRIRNEKFFMKMYGSSKEDVKKNLTVITWCPKLIGQKINVTKINGVNKQLISISKELDEHPEWKNYLANIGGTFAWRNIKGTNRPSMHSFGMTIDLNTKYSDYWQWTAHTTNEQAKLKYKNKIPAGIVSIFEKYGFIWGGKWYHYDTMHFEYRPELL